MDEKAMRKEYWREILTAALVLGLLCAVKIVLTYVFNSNTLLNWVLFFYEFTVIAWTLVHYGKKASRMPMFAVRGFTYGAAFGFSMLVLLVSGILVGLCQWFMTNVVDPAYYAEANRKAIELVIQSNPAIGDAMIEGMQKGQAMMSSIWMMVFAGMFTMVFQGGLVALVTSTFVKRPPNPFDERYEGTGNSTLE